MLKKIVQFLQNLFKFGQNQTQGYAASNIGEIQQPSSDFINSKISYSDDLILHLKHDHVELVELFAGIASFIQQELYDDIAPALEALKSKFNLHIMQENLHFYCYLEQSFQDQQEQLEMIKRYRKEMNAISAAVVRFIKKWQSQPIDEDTICEFNQEYNAVGEVLAKRIHEEEHHLYTLYQPETKF